MFTIFIMVVLLYVLIMDVLLGMAIYTEFNQAVNVVLKTGAEHYNTIAGCKRNWLQDIRVQALVVVTSLGLSIAILYAGEGVMVKIANIALYVQCIVSGLFLGYCFEHRTLILQAIEAEEGVQE
jgi:hypothetical protein